jgi:pyrroloquinoline quinone (PQQ) biosynthesis protein C
VLPASIAGLLFDGFRASGARGTSSLEPAASRYTGECRHSQTKLRGLVEHYGFAEGSEAVEYFVLHGERDHEHAAEARERLEDSEDARLVGLAEAALAANWTLLDGVSREAG